MKNLLVVPCPRPGWPLLPNSIATICSCWHSQSTNKRSTSVSPAPQVSPTRDCRLLTSPTQSLAAYERRSEGASKIVPRYAQPSTWSSVRWLKARSATQTNSPSAPARGRIERALSVVTIPVVAPPYSTACYVHPKPIAQQMIPFCAVIFDLGSGAAPMPWRLLNPRQRREKYSGSEHCGHQRGFTSSDCELPDHLSLLTALKWSARSSGELHAPDAIAPGGGRFCRLLGKLLLRRSLPASIVQLP